ncbi:unnamed protein product [Blepharisma stoltei]|uniref:G-protein coupled receptors family 2 profile 2 domain-containing protein n=1 Tax=Blepharisma stoltei TaxID=1481888 RepID=A0AAU9JER9_9CILI|nr:unnamed protein product [Blepharisma stoltei]
MTFSSEEKEILYYVEISSAIPSFLGTSFICLAYIYFKELRGFTFRLVVYLAIADMFTALSFAVPHYLSQELCLIQALVLNYSSLASVLWTSVIAFTLYRGVVNEEMELEGSEINCIFFAWGIPLLLEFLPFITESYGYAEGWCWIKIQNLESDINFQSATYRYGMIWRMVTYYIPLWIVIIYNCLVYWKVTNRVMETMDDVSSDNRTRHLILNRLRLYPFILVFCQVPVTIHRIYAFFDYNELAMFILAICAGFFLLINGFLNAFVYGFTDSVKQSIRKRLYPEEFVQIRNANTLFGSVESQSALFLGSTLM